MLVIHQGDQYAIPCLLTAGDTVLTPINVNDVKISIAGVVKAYSAQELSFDATTGYWLFPIDADETSEIAFDRVDAQATIKVGGTSYYYSPVQRIEASYSIIGPWPEEEVADV